MKTKAKKLLAVLLCLLMVVGVLATPAAAASSKASGKGSSLTDISELLNADSYSEYSAKLDKDKVGKGKDNIVIDVIKDVYYNEDDVVNNTTVEFEVKEGEETDENGNVKKFNYIVIPSPEGSDNKITWKFNVETEGRYVIEIEYRQAENGKTNSIERIFSLNGEVPFSEARSIVLSKVWKYDYLKDSNGKYVMKDNHYMFDYDSNGNDIRPSVSQDAKWVNYVISDANGYYTSPFEFHFKKGENTISLDSTREGVEIKAIKIYPREKEMSYEEYINLHGDISSNRGSAEIKIEAEAPTNVSNVTMYPLYDRTSAITSGLTGAQSAQVQKYNIMGGTQWQTVGEWATYTITVPEGGAGYYGIALRYKQDLLNGMYVSRKVYIDGVMPYAEAAACQFNYDTKWNIKYLESTDGKELQFYLTEGTHEIKLEAVLGDMGAQIQQVRESLSNINNCYLEILKLTGSTPDSNRSYGFARVMPEVLETFIIESQNIKAVYNYLTEVTGLKGEKASTLEQLYLLLYKMGMDESQIAGNLETLKSQIGTLGTWVNDASTSPLEVDYILLQSTNEELPDGDANFWEALWYEIKLFFYSFVTDYSGMTSSNEATAITVGTPIEVWVATGRDQAQIIRNLIDSQFATIKQVDTDGDGVLDAGYTANLKLISAGTLLPSVLADAGPDVSLMESSGNTIDFALRNAVTPLNEFIEEDLENGIDVLSWYPEEATIPLRLHDCSQNAESEITYYGLPDSLTFSMLFYRKDILAQLGYDNPEEQIRTWDDLLAMIPILQYNNMEVGIQNDIYMFIYQNGSEAYSNGGMTINFDDPVVLNAFTTLCNMYTQYSLSYQYDFANRFRTGEMPIGISAYTSCNQLSVFASELSGLWTFMPLPGYLEYDENGNQIFDENGNPSINNSAIATVTSTIMLRASNSLSNAEVEERNEKAWEFMKWYTGSEFQEAYANEMVSIMGLAARPATANIEALAELPWTNEEYQAISAQFSKLEAVPNYPGSYYLARYVNFAFLAAYNEGADPADSLLGYVTTINKELTRRRIEFGMDYIDDDGIYRVAE